MEPTEQQDEGCFRRVGMIKEKSPKVIKKIKKDDFSENKAHNGHQSRVHGMSERENIDSFERDTNSAK